jgi:hypothetical protein
MTFHFDNIAATLISGVIVLLLVGMQLRTREVNIEQTAFVTAKGQALDLGDWLQQDLGNAGAGVPINEQFIEDYEVDAETENTKRFSFRRKILESDASPTLITYELIDGEKTVVKGDTVQLYQVQRCEGAATCPAGSSDVSGQSPPGLTYFRIDLLDENGGAWTAGTSNAYYLRVRFSVTSVFGMSDRDHMREAHWGTVLPVRERDS